MKLALGLIMKSLNSDAEVMRFIDNAEKYGHALECVFVAYSQNLSPRAEESIRNKIPFYPIDIRDPGYCIDQFRRRGISDTSARTLLECPVDTGIGLVPYGFNRTIVTIEAILRGVDVLFFVDYDVYPSVLKQSSGGRVIEEVDFFGEHLKHLNSGSQITTGEYSGYNILPPASFDGMGDLLNGLQKPEMIEYWQSSGTHRCLTYQTPVREPKPCTKILGGNTGIKLSAFSTLPPFFSSYYTIGDELFLCRGEDTVLGLGIAKSGVVCTDIGLNPLHDTYFGYPDEPDLLGDQSVQSRFYYACTGWVGRNPFLNHIRGSDMESVREYQRKTLEQGLTALSEYTSNPRFISVLNNFDVSWNNLGRYISEYETVLEAWSEFLERTDMK